MSKDKHKKQLDRKEFLNRLKKKPPVPDDKEILSEFSQRALKGIQYLPEEVDFSEALHQIDRSIEQKTRPKKRFLPFLLKIAAGFLVLVAASYFLFISSPSPQELFSQSFYAIPSAIPQSGIDRGILSGSLDDPLKALVLYEKGKYIEAIPLFESHLKKNPDHIELRFYYGIALLALKEGKRAIKQFKLVEQDSSNIAYQRSAKWYQALGFLLGNKKQKAQDILEELKQQEGDFNQEAIDLLNHL